MKKEDLDKCLNAIDEFIKTYPNVEVSKKESNFSGGFSKDIPSDGRTSSIIKVYPTSKETIKSMFTFVYEVFRFDDGEKYFVYFHYGENVVIHNPSFELFEFALNECIKNFNKK